MDGAQVRLQNAVTKMVDDIDAQYLRKLQYDMYNCSAKCCGDKKMTMDEVQQCVEKCSTPVNEAQAYLQQEMNSFQQRVQRCAMDCNDKVKDQMPGKPTDKDYEHGKSMMETCVAQCADLHVNLVPQLTRKLLDQLKN